MTTPELYAQIEAIAKAWPEPRDEPNLQDLHWLAVVLIARMALALPDEFPPHERGVEIVELVERTVLLQSRDHLLRFNPPADLVRLCDDLVRAIREHQLLQHDDATNFVAALLTWVGCLRMAKSLRAYDSIGQAYTDEIRQREYARLTALWNQRGGSWIRYGTTLARAFEGGRGNPIVEEWVPRNSPYWAGAEHEDAR
jgi:hypothetical protein